MTSPFEVLGLAPTMELDPEALESAYLRMSRATHPDYHQDLDATTKLDVLARSAAVNDAYRTLKDPWRRAETLISMHDPIAMEKTKTLCPMFLMEAMETREAVAFAVATDFAGLAHDIRARVDQYFHDVAGALGRGDYRQAATLLHQSNYYRKALAELENRMHAA